MENTTHNLDDVFNEMIMSNDTEKIKEFILNKFSKKNGPQKSVSFYKTLVRLYPNMTSMVRDLIDNIPEWGYWKDYFMILLYSEDCPELADYIYELLINQLEVDWENFETGNEISMLAKWIPRQGKSFDKKYGFVKQICSRMYPNDGPKVGKTKYRKMVSTLNKHLGTAEIYLCSKEYEKIDFNKVPSKCLHRNMKTFLENDVTKSKLQIHLFKKYIRLDFKGFMDRIIFKKNSNFEKKILIEVWNMNKYDFSDQIENLVGVNVKTADVLIDTSKSMYDEKLISISVGVALLAKYFGNQVIINAYEPYILNFNDPVDEKEDAKAKRWKFDLFRAIDVISQECAFYDKINFDALFDKDLVKKSKLIVVTNKECDNDFADNHKGKPKVFFWELTEDTNKLERYQYKNVNLIVGNFYSTINVAQEKTKENKQMVKNLIDDSDDIIDINYNHFLLTGIYTFVAVGFLAIIASSFYY